MGEPMTYFVAAVPARTADAAMRAVGQFEGIVRLAHGTESEPKPLIVDVARLDAAAYARKPGNVDPWVHHYVTTTYGIDVMTLPEAAERAPDFVRLQIDEAVATIQRALIEGLVAGVDVRGVPDE